MEIKKSFKADLRNKRGLLLEIGVVLALVLVISAFTYAPKEYRIEQVELSYVPDDVEMIDVTRDRPRETQPRKIEVRIPSQVIQVVDNNTKMETDIDMSIFNNDEPIEFVVPAPEPAVEDEIFLIAETMPSFMDGTIETFRAWVMQNVKFPQIAADNNIQGRVVLSFVIDKDGRLTDIEVLQSPDRSLSEEAIRVLSKSPKWSPGKQRNQTVRVKYTLPVEFRMQN
ncbi:energy transducer TonB [Alistipes sp. kh20]|uniref:energy transducer TonB n=1 Tax=Alistipes montrealensis TaxID=2834113 RepID=UPI001BCFE5A7|nr:energy transducer TonB [Alistipes montrealensis]MBS4765650.1 energy transducer TonB [Alistipes montrealensis]